MTDTPVYMVVMLDITDMDAFRSDYVGPLQPHNARHAVEVLAATPAPEVLEGTYSKSMTVLLKFASAQAQQAWYNAPAYQPLLKRRFELTDTDTSVALLLPQFQP